RDELANITHVAAIGGDVTAPTHREALAVLARGHAGLDAVINNAGSLGPSPQPELLDYPLETLTKVFEANVVAPLGVLQALRDELKPGARIINITSDAGVNAYQGWGGYGSSKAALEQMSAVLAAESPSLRVYWVDPGDMRTDMHQAAFPGQDISDRPRPCFCHSPRRRPAERTLHRREARTRSCGGCMTAVAIEDSALETLPPRF